MFRTSILIDKPHKNFYNTNACSEGRSFVGNDWLDKAQAEMSVLYPAFFVFNNISGGVKKEWIF